MSSYWDRRWDRQWTAFLLQVSQLAREDLDHWWSVRRRLLRRVRRIGVVELLLRADPLRSTGAEERNIVVAERRGAIVDLVSRVDGHWNLGRVIDELGADVR